MLVLAARWVLRNSAASQQIWLTPRATAGLAATSGCRPDQCEKVTYGVSLNSVPVPVPKRECGHLSTLPSA